MMRLVSAALVALGISLIGWWAGYMLFAGVFELLRARDLDAALDSPGALALFQYAGAALGLGIGSLVAWRCHRAQPPRPLWGVYLPAALGGLGGFALSQATEIAELAATYLRISKDTYILISILSMLVMLIAGCVFVLATETRAMPTGKRLAHGIGTVALAFALVILGFAASKPSADTARNLGRPATGWANIRFPSGSVAQPDVKSITAEMRTPIGVTRAAPNEWRQEHGRQVLAVMIDFKLRTRDRQLVLTLPDQPPLVFKPPFPANPAAKFGYSPWLRLDGFLNADGTIRPATAEDDYAIRYMVNR
jgi:hypothetical protein